MTTECCILPDGENAEQRRNGRTAQNLFRDTEKLNRISEFCVVLLFYEYFCGFAALALLKAFIRIPTLHVGSRMGADKVLRI